MAPIRLRHPKGVSTIDIDIENATVQDLQQEILSVSEILPSQQELKAGYPPRPLTLVPELPMASLGLQRGDQVIVIQKMGAPTASSTAAAADHTLPRSNSVSAAIPASSTPEPVQSRGSNGPDFVHTDAGVLVHRIVPDDNSCLFSSIALLFEQDMQKALHIRKLVAEEIRRDWETWNEAILGRPRDEYISTILKPSSWGGAIELAILAKHYSTEIASIDVETGRIDRFTPPDTTNSGNRCVLIYSGIHYDAASLAPMEDAPPDFHQTVFPVIGGDEAMDSTLKAAKELVSKLRAKRAFTNTSTFTLKCEICKQGLKGEKEARQHAKDTGHTSFGEY